MKGKEMLTYKGKKIPMWLIIVTLFVPIVLAALVTLID